VRNVLTNRAKHIWKGYLRQKSPHTGSQLPGLEMEQKTGLHIWTARKENRRWRSPIDLITDYLEETFCSQRWVNLCSPFIIFTIHTKIPQISIFTSLWRDNMTSRSHLWLANQTKPKQARWLPSPASCHTSLLDSSTKWTHWFSSSSYFKYPNHSHYSKFAQLEQQSQMLELLFCSFWSHSSHFLLQTYTHIQ